MNFTALVQLNAIERTLAEAKTVDAIINIKNQAEAMRQCFRLAGYGLEMQNDAAEVKLRAERRAGEMLKEMNLQGGDRKSKFHDGTLKLADLDVTNKQSHRWQQESSVPQEDFEQYVAETKVADKELTSAGLLRIAKKALQEKEREETRANVLVASEADAIYKTIVIDSPWPIQKIVREVRPNQDVFDYHTLSLEEIGKLPIQQLADSNGCHIYLWVTQKYLPQGLHFFEQWQVKYQCLLTWVKPTGFTPFSWMYNTEHVLFGRIGSLKLMKLGLKLSFEAPVTKHSEKPDVFFERVVEASPPERLNMFARKERDGFKGWGNELRGNELL